MSQTMDPSVRFWNWYAARYAKKAIAEPEVYEQKLALTRKYLNPNTSVLEFGCGTGSTALLHAGGVRDILGVDSSEEMIRIARVNAKEAGTANASFQHGTLFDVAGSGFDVVLGLNVLHLVPDLDAALKRCYELTAPGGYLISSTPCLGNESGLMKLLLPIGGKLGLIPRVYFFSAQTLLKRIAAAGFAVQEEVMLNKSGHSAFVVAQK